jgi:thioredoxin reductase (NADPH)
MENVFDLTIIGAGPTGLYASYYAGFRGLKVKLIDSLEELGGQVTALYPEKFIFDVAGFPRVYGKELVKDLIDQAMQYHPSICLGEHAQQLQALNSGYVLTTDKGAHATRAVLITMGLGAFRPKKLPLPGAERFEGKGLSYSSVPDITCYDQKRVMIIGGGNSAVDWALNLLPRAASLTLVHRRDGFRAHEESVRQLKKSHVILKLFYEIKELQGKDRLESVTIFNNKTQAEETLPIDEILACLGFEASVGPLAEWGLKLEGNDIPVTTRMETNLAGVYAAGDIASYAGKVKLIATGFGEAATAVNNAAAYLQPGTRVFPGHSSNLSK